MNFDIKHQESYSRGQLLLRSLFGILYIGIPHMFVLYFIMIGVAVVNFIAWWAILFTGKYPEGMFHFVEKYLRWSTRVSARFMHLADGYPAFGLNAEDDAVTLEIPYPESLSRGQLILRSLFGMYYIFIPHMFVLYFRMIAMSFVMFIAWWIVLFTGKYPEGMHKFNVGTFRWYMRVIIIMMNMTDKYPPFSGAPDTDSVIAA